jgi:gelsolin
MELGAEALVPASVENQTEAGQPALYRLSDESATIAFARVPLDQGSLSSNDAFLLDNSQDPLHPAVYVWIGRNASLNERRLSMQYAQNYLHKKKQETGRGRVATCIIKQEEGSETAEFIHKLKSEV